MNSETRTDSKLAAITGLVAGLLFFLSTKATEHVFDYTNRIAGAFLNGHVGLIGPRLSWLNEMVPIGGESYSVFPLGAVLANIPAAILQKLRLVQDWPAHVQASLIAGACVYFFFRLSFVAEMARARRIMISLFPVFATWTWCNLGFGGAWQMALGFAVLGEAASLYYTLVRPRPLAAGAWFALACGNRTELILTLPIFIYLFLRSVSENDGAGFHVFAALRREWKKIAWFVAVPALLMIATAAYNYVRFGSVTDFGYSRIPGVLNEPWYTHGLFSLHAIRWNVYQMLFKGMRDIQGFPYLQPDPFGGSIFMCSPMLFLLFREGGKHKMACWFAIGVVTLFLWCHGNAGGWQFSYRYAMTLIPWMFVIIAENGPRTVSITESSIFFVSLLINGLAVYEFLWTTDVHP